MKTVKFLGYILGSLISILFFLITASLVYKYAINSFAFGKTIYNKKIAENQEVVLTIPEGADLIEVSNILEANGLIKNALFFQIESYLLGARSGFVADTYKLNTDMDSYSLRWALRNPDLNQVDDIVVVLREGLTIKDMGEILENKGVVSQVDFISACENEEFDYPFLKNLSPRPNKLEGYLFPDTYYFVKDMDPKLVVSKMLDRFDEIFKDEYIVRASELGKSIDEIVTMASIIEKEIRVGDERKKASSVIYNRINQGINLQMCSTVIYISEKGKDRLLDSDLKIESPYNTYINSGLPVGPIANPGEKCIEAALYPDDTNYLYFVIKNEETGEHFFTNNYDEFLNAKALYNQRF